MEILSLTGDKSPKSWSNTITMRTCLGFLSLILPCLIINLNLYHAPQKMGEDLILEIIFQVFGQTYWTKGKPILTHRCYAYISWDSQCLLFASDLWEEISMKWNGQEKHWMIVFAPQVHMHKHRSLSITVSLSIGLLNWLEKVASPWNDICHQHSTLQQKGINRSQRIHIAACWYGWLVHSTKP